MRVRPWNSSTGLLARSMTQITAIESVHVSAYIEQLQKAGSALLRHLFDWMANG
jgi:hypothetical protein